jgi:RNA polymerase sigma-70 factor (ECF subfamily)
VRFTEPVKPRLRAVGVSPRPTSAVTDEATLRALYADHAGAVRGFATRLTGDAALAEDVVQETLLRAWRRPDALEADRGPVRPWLFTIARHVVIDLARARSARPQEVGADALRGLPAIDEIDRAVESWAVADALAGLSAPHRAVLLETYYRGSSVAQAAARLGIPPGTVKSRAYYALRELRLLLQEKGVTR